ncbi:hypothetical protein BZA77DRAFT_344732 [Pyronema omphalodes]|nr:hypothetical protein BZA77DRAFT_344732 [Pyronema omphalodes]
MSANKDIVWPPQTTQDVLNLTPRKNRVQHFSPANPPTSPSPLRRSTGPKMMDDGPSDDGSDTDEDEELLKLKLARIEAKLKLKKLQRQQQKKKQVPSAASIAAASAVEQQKKAEAQIQVPVSPSAKQILAQAPPSPKSPSRVLLGIDRGLTGKDVSLRRAPQYRKQPPPVARAPSPPRPAKTFSQRLAEERSKDKQAAEKKQHIASTRSKGFGLEDSPSTNRTSRPVSWDSKTTGSLSLDSARPSSRDSSVSTAAAQKATHSFTSMLDSGKEPPKTNMSASFSFGTTSTVFTGVPTAVSQSFSGVPSQRILPVRPSTAPSEPTYTKDKEESTDEAGFDSFSGLHLSRRTTPHATVTRHLSNKTVYQLPQLLKIVVSPSYEPPDVEGDWVVLAIICSKSDPRAVGQNTTSEKTGKKYMVMQLTDLKWEIELFLFGAGFERFWKLPVGTVIALLNPGVMKPRNNDSGKFSLTITDDSADCVLEIGAARDLGFCRTTKRDGKQCNTWIDKRHTSFCAFHVEQTVKKARSARAEVSSMTAMFSPPKKGTVKPRKFFGGRGGGRGQDNGLLNEGPIMDMPQRMGGAGGAVYVAPGRSTAQLLDDDDYLASNFRSAGGTKEERLHRRLEEGKRERELTKRIIESQGRDGGLGAQYLKARIGETEEGKKATKAAAESRKQASEALASLRSKAQSARDVKLSPIRRKRSGADLQPVMKKTRFKVPDDSDDELDIVHE